MSRQNLIVMAVGATALVIWPLTHAIAQSGDAVAHAENICMAYGVGPNTPAFNACVDRAASAYDQGRPSAAQQEAAIIRDANDLCRSYGIAPATRGYRECVGHEIDRRTSMHPVRYMSDETPRATARIDAFGFHYDSDGNLIDKDGYPIRAVP
jgi:hypothetical protein